MYSVVCKTVLGHLSKPLMSIHVHFLGPTGWVGRVPPGLKEFFNLPFLVLKARHPVNPI